MPAIPVLMLDYVDVRDAAEAHVRAIEQPGINGERIYLGAGSLTMRQIADECRKEFG
jgi:nucleoside-diphosphate-sugar epimerase